MKVDEDPKEDPEEVIPHAVASPPGSPPISPPPLSKSSSDSDFAAPATADGTLWVPPSGSTFERRMDAFDVDIAFVKQATARVEDDVIALQTRAETTEDRFLQVEQDRIRDMEEIKRLKT
ncbi:hypothetical protein Tco_1394812 [Tanacetum coccineum]